MIWSIYILPFLTFVCEFVFMFTLWLLLIAAVKYLNRH